jgi:MOSC domain-containing protein YiiM
MRIVEEGDVGGGDPIEVVERPSHAVTVAVVARAYHEDQGLAGSLLAAPALAEGWRQWALQHVDGSSR